VFQRDATNSLHLLLVVHLSIDLGSGNVLMTKHMLHHMERRSIVKLQASVGVSGIGGVNGRYARHDGELPNLRFLGEFVLQISPRRSRVEQVNNLNILSRGYALSPVG
jgi:hypothetical protein